MRKCAAVCSLHTVLLGFAAGCLLGISVFLPWPWGMVTVVQSGFRVHIQSPLLLNTFSEGMLSVSSRLTLPGTFSFSFSGWKSP